MTDIIIIYLIIFCPILTVVFLCLFDYIADSDIWIRRQDRDQ